ncbi:hypothetical protein PR370_18595 [Mycobacterium marinum]|uniref:hypothetical protein n=1 Tax=Mycobacterium marinum TaxID=1781 RepID=UPI0023581C84|nr:hypothetical protein [Mycobacterium marinum]MDC8984354.1 hypothetical protein [Mycobacterium marinum]MDC9001455.1 hypothetical protein [Mycobacterium marinum]MDC9012041.1 hypothetical protein [Mycobacterium marinum]
MPATPHDNDELSPAGQRWLARPTTDVGPAIPPPAWCAPGTDPDWERLSEQYGGALACFWARYFPNDDGDVWIKAEDRIIDGRIRRTDPAIHYTEPPSEGVTPAQARQLAAELLNAADVLDEQ